MTRLTATRASRTSNRASVDLNGDDRLPRARQNLLRLRQHQPQFRHFAESIERRDIHDVDDPCRPVNPRLSRQVLAEKPGYLLKSFLCFRRGYITVPRAMWHAFMDVEYRFHASAF